MCRCQFRKRDRWAALLCSRSLASAQGKMLLEFSCLLTQTSTSESFKQENWSFTEYCAIRLMVQRKMVIWCLLLAVLESTPSIFFLSSFQTFSFQWKIRNGNEGHFWNDVWCGRQIRSDSSLLFILIDGEGSKDRFHVLEPQTYKRTIFSKSQKF